MRLTELLDSDQKQDSAMASTFRFRQEIEAGITPSISPV